MAARFRACGRATDAPPMPHRCTTDARPRRHSILAEVDSTHHGVARVEWTDAVSALRVLAAFDDLRQVFGGRWEFLTFAFGPVHGFGFPGVLAELHLLATQVARALLQFSVGLDLGQLLIVADVTDLLFLSRCAFAAQSGSSEVARSQRWRWARRGWWSAPPTSR